MLDVRPDGASKPY